MTLLLLSLLLAADWTEPVHVFHDENLCVAYQARVDGPYLVVRAQVSPGWHTFTMDNKIRATEALAKSGKKVLGMDQPTRITLTGGLKAAGPWLQSKPQDFSKPASNWFSWGYEGEAFFAAKVTGAGATKIQLRGQSCSDKSCRNVDVEIDLSAAPAATAPELKIAELIPVRLN